MLNLSFCVFLTENVAVRLHFLFKIEFEFNVSKTNYWIETHNVLAAAISVEGPDQIGAAWTRDFNPGFLKKVSAKNINQSLWQNGKKAT